MAWAEKAFDKDKKLRGYRGRYRDSAGNKQWVKDDRGRIVIHPRKRDAEHAAQDKEVKARRQSAPSKGRVPATIKWGDWWDLIVQDRTFDFSDNASFEARVVELHLRPKWGAVPLNAIERPDVQRWVTSGELKVRAGMKPSSVHRIYGVFRVSINQALKEEVLTASPCVGIELPRAPKNRRKRYASETDMEKLVPHLGQEIRDILEFDFETGLRPGELGGLHADHVDLNSGWVEVEHVLIVREGKLLIRPWPKDKEPRRVGLTDKAQSIVQRRLDGRDLKRGCGVHHTDGTACESVLVFLNKFGDPVTSRKLFDYLRERIAKAQIPHLTPYAFRRGFATRLGRNGVDPFAIGDILGHADVKETRGYVQETDQATRASMFAALGQRAQLTLVDGGARGADSGANPDAQALPVTPSLRAEDVG